MIKIAIDMGDSLTKIYRIGNGIVLVEPSCVAIDLETNKIKAVGDAAKALFGKATDYTSVQFPVRRGEIDNETLAVTMLKYFLEKSEIRPSQFSSVHALFSLPCGVRSATCSAYYRVADACGIGKISFVETPYLAATGMNAPISDTSPVFSVDIGGGMTNISVVSYDGIIAGVSLGLAGRDIDNAIADFIEQDASVEIGPVTREELKNEVGSLIEGDARNKIVRGKRLDGWGAEALNVYSENLVEPICESMAKLFYYIEMVLSKIPAEVYASIYRTGIQLSGGVSSMPGLKEYMEEYFKLPVRLTEESPVAVVLGAGRMIEDAALLKKVKIRY